MEHSIAIMRCRVMKNNRTWLLPVVFKAGNNEAIEISDLEDAVHFLMFRWRWIRGDSYEAALRAFGLVVRGLIDPDAGRVFFVKAIKDRT